MIVDDSSREKLHPDPRRAKAPFRPYRVGADRSRPDLRKRDPRNGPSISSMARPRTADQARYSASWATLGRQRAGSDEPVKRRAQQFKGIEPAIPGLGRIRLDRACISDREGGAEQSRLFLRKAQIGGPYRTQARTSEGGGTVPRGNSASSASIAFASAEKAAERTACRSSYRLAKCR